MKKDAPIKLTRKGSIYLLPRRFKPKIGKSTYIEGKKFDCLLIIGKIYFFVKSKCYKSKTNILGTLNVYKISANEHQVSDRWVTDEISVFKILLWKYLEYVPLILRNCK